MLRDGKALKPKLGVPCKKRSIISGVPFTREDPGAHQAVSAGDTLERALMGAVRCGVDGISIAHDLDWPPW